ncbi:hypothetical protein J1N35_034174 [Gossypium stocksii]|uniref:Uncharacterized protein n=1 Tax=Gossypium stocksii TaxID=47602 RepID=A0A9D3ZPT7_9ROSI|nr:hypothetical protein J1N35_034174 [Gossypium stocksii]
MARTGGSVKKAPKPIEEHLSSTTTVQGLTLWDATKINELYNTKVDIDEHAKFIEDSTDEKRDLLVKDLCVEGALWTGSHRKELYDAPPFPDTAKKIDVGIILHQEITDYVVRQTGILVFPSLGCRGVHVEVDIIASQGASAVKEEIVVEKKDAHVEVVNEKVEKKDTETEAIEKKSIEDIVNAS